MSPEETEGASLGLGGTFGMIIKVTVRVNGASITSSVQHDDNPPPYPHPLYARLPAPTPRQTPSTPPRQQQHLPQENPQRSPLSPILWVQCDHCSEWTALPPSYPLPQPGERWTCNDAHWDALKPLCHDTEGANMIFDYPPLT
mmetsp:Transcript_17285/g.34674  ORF Transcript_17285/g.34674 Transcript_17285/m.34674 type:complete len:143 (-) Transcript_17285:76-504(-)